MQQAGIYLGVRRCWLPTGRFGLALQGSCLRVFCKIQGGCRWVLSSRFEHLYPPRGQIGAVAASGLEKPWKLSLHPHLFGCALEDAQVRGGTRALAQTRPPPARSCVIAAFAAGRGGELLEMGVRLNAWLESAWRGCVRFFPAVYRLQKPAFPTLYPLRRQKPRFYC